MPTCTFCKSESLAHKRSMRPLFWKMPRGFYRCELCLGFTLIPKLSNEELNELYSNYYLGDSHTQGDSPDGASDNWLKKYKSLIKYLQAQKLHSKQFLDFGCGVDAYGIQVAKDLGLTVSGLEISAKTRNILEVTTDCKIFSPEELQVSTQRFDYILLSDVLEHATDPSLILEQAIQHLTENGVLLIQGPLEGTKNFTNLFLHIYSFLTPNKVANSLPYHVSLANKKSIERLLRTNALKIDEMLISETWWPAPKSISSFEAIPRVLPQIFAKLLDFTASVLLPNYGSRFWLVASKSTE